MPLYEYECAACGERFEVIQQKFSDPPPEACTKCGKGPVQRLMSSPAIQFKGSGFYITDYAQKGKSGAESSGSGKSEKKSDTGSSDSSSPKTESSTGSTSTPAPPSTTKSGE